MDMKELFDKLPPIVLAEKATTSGMTNARRLKIIAIPVVRDLLDLGGTEPHPSRYMELTGDETDYNLCVATGRGNHGKGGCLHKDCEKRIRRVRENVISILRFADPTELAALLDELNLTQDEFIQQVRDLPSVVVMDDAA